MIGFVYILINPHFSVGVYKVGCTERSPHERALELSKGTGVPAPFEVLCYIEVDNFQQAERDLHTWLQHYRISQNRAFFDGGLEHAVGWMWWHQRRLSFCSPRGNEIYGESMLHVADFGDFFEGHDKPSVYSLPNPWGGEHEPPAREIVPGPNFPDDLPWETAADKPDLKVVGGTEL